MYAPALRLNLSMMAELAEPPPALTMVFPLSTAVPWMFAHA
jgi:hypothetical protein